jgi:hypothetical protein
MPTSSFSVPLPSSWPKHAKAATLHVISLAHFALTQVREYTVSDQGGEFGEAYLEWCDDHDVRGRFGAVGRHGSIAVEERFIRTLKQEGLAHELVRLHHGALCASLARFEDWCNDVRPHSCMGGATPEEVLHGRRPTDRRRRFEPRARYPAKGACAAPWAPARVEIGARLDLVATPFRGAWHLAQVEIRRGERLARQRDSRRPRATSA